jgi:hypothetical protein
MAYEFPKPGDTIRIGDITWGNPSLVTKFPPSPNLKSVQNAMEGWNREYRKYYIRFSVVKLPENKFFGHDRYGLISWVPVDSTTHKRKR